MERTYTLKLMLTLTFGDFFGAFGSDVLGSYSICSSEMLAGILLWGNTVTDGVTSPASSWGNAVTGGVACSWGMLLLVGLLL